MGNSTGTVDWSKEHGRALRDRRRQAGYSQESLAEAAAVDRKTLSLLEQGRRQPRFGTIRAIADALGVAYEDLARTETRDESGTGVTRAQLVWRRLVARDRGDHSRGMLSPAASSQPTPSAPSGPGRVVEIPVDPDHRRVESVAPTEEERPDRPFPATVAEPAVRRQRGRQRIVIGLLMVVAASIALVAMLRGWSRPGELDPHLVAVAAMENATGDPALDPIGQQASAWIAEQIAKFGLVYPAKKSAVLSNRVVKRSLPGSSSKRSGLRDVAEQTGAGIVICGHYRVDGNTLSLRAEIVDARTDDIIYAVPLVSGPRVEPMQVIETVGEKLLGAAAAHFDDYLPRPRLVPPPSWAAYREFRARYWSPNPPGQDLDLRARSQVEIEHLLKAEQIDPRFLAPRFRLFDLYYHQMGDVARAESTLVVLNSVRAQMTPYELLKADAYGAMYARDYAKARRYLRGLLALDPRDQFVLLGSGITALLVNRPHEAIEMLASMRPETWHSYLGATRYVWLCQAYHMAGEYQKELELARMELFPDHRDVIAPAAALGCLDDVWQEVNRSLEAENPHATGDIRHVFVDAVGELRWHGYTDAAAQLAARAVEFFENLPPDEAATWRGRRDRAICLYLAERWTEAKSLFEQLAAERPHDMECQGFMGALSARLGEQEEARRILGDLCAAEQYRPSAGIAALLGEHELALQLLRDAYWHGDRLGLAHAKMDLEPLRGYAPFEEFAHPEQ